MLCNRHAIGYIKWYGDHDTENKKRTNKFRNEVSFTLDKRDAMKILI